MRGEEAIAYIHSFNWKGHAPGLERMRRLLQLVGEPQRKLRFVHVAGTNGKGSTCACIAAILQAEGYRVGLNTSPYIVSFCERIQVDGQMIPLAELAELTEYVRPFAEAMEEHPTEFELITAIALLYFLKKQCDIVVLEVGLGGGLDASNVIDVPEAAVLTAMGLDHMEQLGPTLTQIAQAKAGIIKSGGAVVSMGTCPEADRAFRQVCAEKRAELTEADLSRMGEKHMDLSGSTFDFAPYRALRLNLAGAYQLQNAALAITVAETLGKKGWRVSEAGIRQGLARVRWPGRFELLRARPAVLLDGAHNAHGMAAAAESLRALLGGKKAVCVLGILADKDAEEMVALLAPLAQQVLAVTPDSPRAMAAADLAAMTAARGVPSESCPTVRQAMERAIALAGEEGCVCALGSLYLCAQVKAAVAAIRSEQEV